MISIGSISRFIVFEHDFAHSMLSGSAARLLSWSVTRSLSLAGDSVVEVSRLTRLMGFSPGHAPPWVNMIRHKTYPAVEKSGGGRVVSAAVHSTKSLAPRIRD